ncbi:MAG: Flp pilus assembly complex ATPase component TadA [Planctomycetes bacterium]|nr:Flp pilus assembly complex ATPase component TadA [Planctomycetota bacterium]
MSDNEFLDLVGDLKEQLEEQILLDDINKKILSTLDLTEVLNEISVNTCKLLNCDRTTVYVVDQDANDRHLISRTEIDGEISEISLPHNHDSIAGFVACTGRMLILKDVYDTAELEAVSPLPKFDKSWDQKTGYRTKSMLVAAAKVGDRTVGVIQALNKHANGFFDNNDIELMNKLTNYVGIALQNSQSHTHIMKKSKTKSTLNELLVERGLVKELQLRDAQERARQERKKLLDVLIEQYDVSEVEITKIIAEMNDVEFIEYSSDLNINPELFENIPEAYARRHMLCPYKQTLDQNGELQISVIMHNPKDFIAIEDMEIRTGSKVNKVFMATRKDILKSIKLTLHPEATEEETDDNIGDLFNALAEDLGVEQEEDVEAVNIKDGAKEDDAPIVKLCNRIIEDAYRLGGSDVHIEPMENSVLIRVRRDGSLEKTLQIPLHAKNALVARYKIMSELNITEHRVPQDGRIRFKEHGGRYDIELRVNICPTVGGNEDIVMRILADSKPLPLEKMGFMPWVIEPYQRQFTKPYGMILCVGPTGSGKTTTLHSTIANINTPDRKILTAENPVEITQVGLRQVQVKPEVGMTFKEALRAFLRQDPDVIMVGEMRDFETCSIAIEAALTGHLLFSTLHTNNAPETVTRLVDIGIDPVTLSDALLCVLAQRLTKTLCSKCRVKSQLPDKDLEMIGARIENGMYKYLDKEFPVSESYVIGEGCDKCNGSGLKGRMGIHELLIATDEVKKMIVGGARIHEIREGAKQWDDHNDYRMYELAEDGFFKVLMGGTDVRSIRSVCVE